MAWLGAPLVLGALAQALRSQSAGWDAVVSHWGFPCGWLAALLAPRLPHVAFFHSGDVHVLARVPAIGAPIAQTIAGRARVLAFSSAELRERFAVLTARARSTARVEIAPMGIDPIEPAEREAARAALGIEPARFVVLAMSRLVPIKGLDVAVEAIARVPGASLVIAGDGPERSSLSQRARTLDVRFVGVIAGEDKRLWLHAADAFTAPSRSLPGGRTEGAPTAVLEAMHAGLPVIATRTGGLPELVCDGVSGLLIPPDEAGALAAAIETLMHQPGLRARLAEGARLRGAQAAWPALIDRIEAWIEPSPPPAFMASPGAPRAED